MQSIVRWFGIIALIGGLVFVSSGMAFAQNHDHSQHNSRTFHGDRIVQSGLIVATAKTTGQKFQAIKTKVDAGSSIAAIATENGSSSDAVLVQFDQGVDTLMARAVKRGRLPQSVADARARWYKQNARLQIDVGGVAFPGLHEMHGITIHAATNALNIKRREVVQHLKSCGTLEQLFAEHNATTQTVVDQALTTLDPWLDTQVSDGTLSPTQRDQWRATLITTIEKMTTTPGLHVAGKECAN